VPQPGELKLYQTGFSAALPPMASEKTVVPTLKKLKTVSFLDQVFSLLEPGLYGIEIGGKSVGGLLVESTTFPDLVSAQDLIQPLIYLTTADERNKLYSAKDPKAAVDKFWLGVNPNQNEARRLIRLYYERVTAANKFFTAHKAGWLTDRGMIYMIFGPPEEVQRYTDREEWIYPANLNHNQVRFIFLKKENTFTQNHYELVRSPYYEQVWYDMVEQWRKGTIAK
jgi:GWxTD domain-containing protein